MLLGLISLSAALLIPSTPHLDGRACTRGAFLKGAVVGGIAFCVPTQSRAEDESRGNDDSNVVMRGVLQMQKDVEARLPSNIKSAEVQIRVVGRNTKGPLATVEIPVEGTSFPIDYTISRSDLREGLADFIWLEEDIYVKADLKNTKDKVYAEGRSKAKFVNEDGKKTHKVAYLTLE